MFELGKFYSYKPVTHSYLENFVDNRVSECVYVGKGTVLLKLLEKNVHYPEFIVHQFDFKDFYEVTTERYVKYMNIYKHTKDYLFPGCFYENIKDADIMTNNSYKLIARVKIGFTKGQRDE